MNQNTKEGGRSMTEMLGVLAVMAVLTIGGIVGYNYAMNKHRSNVILNDVRRITAFVLSSKFMENDDGTLADLDVEVESMTPYEVAKETEKTFYITAGEVSKEICDILTAEKPAYAEDIVANAMGTKTCVEGDNEIYFYINSEMSGLDEDDKPLECSASEPCGPCAECTAGRCIDKNDKCPSGQYCVNGTCGCIGDSFYSAGLKQCLACPAGSKPNVDKTGCTGCPAGQFWNSGGYATESLCTACFSTGSTTAPNEECIKCDNLFPTTEHNGCYSCTSQGGWAEVRKTTLQFCNRCPNRYFDTPTSTCKTCPTGQVKNAAGTGCQ